MGAGPSSDPLWWSMQPCQLPEPAWCVACSVYRILALLPMAIRKIALLRSA